jgi:predicted HTH transcriptional regulator
MPKLTEILKQPEGRRLEFKAQLPTGKSFSDMESGQSDIRNKTLAPVFKRLGIIEQWGNGLKLIKEELQTYPEIELSWKEPGIAFRITFTNKKYSEQHELQPEFENELSAIGTKLAPGWH